MKKIEWQQENVKHLLKLIVENPELKIAAMVDSEIVADDGFMWWLASFGEASVEEIWNDDERLHIRSVDEDTLVENVCDGLCDDPVNDGLSDEELEKKAITIVDSYAWEKVIAVRINLP